MRFTQAEKTFYETALVQQAADADACIPSDDPASGLRQRRRNHLQLDERVVPDAAPVRACNVCGCDVRQPGGEPVLSDEQAATVAKARALDTLAQLCLQQCRAVRDQDRDASRSSSQQARIP